MVRYIFCGTTHVHYNAPMQGGHINKKGGAERSAKQMIIWRHNILSYRRV